MPSETHPESPLSEERVREYEQMLSAVTPGPWTSSKSFSGDRALAMVPGERLVIGVVAPSVVDDRREAEANAAFLAASPTIVRDLLDGYRALSERVATLEAENEKLRGRVLFLSQFAKPDASTPNPEVPTHV